MTFSTETALREATLKALQQASDDVILETLIQNERFIEEVVYAAGGGNGYPRTGEFKEAWDETGENIGDAGNSMDYAPEKISTIGGEPFGGFPYGGVHSSVLTGESSAEELVDYIYQGHGGIWSSPARNAFKRLDKWLNAGRIVRLFKKGMTDAGLEVKAGSAHKTVL